MDKQEDTRITQILTDVGELRGIVSKGFEGTNARLDMLNGKVANHESRLNKTETDLIHRTKWEDERAKKHDAEQALRTKSHEWWRKFWVERVIWIALFLAGWVLLATEIIRIPQ